MDDPIAHAARKVLSSIQLRGARDGPEIFAPIQERLHHQPNLLQHDIRLTSVRKQKSCTKSKFIWCRLIVEDRKWSKGSELLPYQPLASYYVGSPVPTHGKRLFLVRLLCREVIYVCPLNLSHRTPHRKPGQRSRTIQYWTHLNYRASP